MRIDHNVVHDNTVGIEVELTIGEGVEDNIATSDAVGILVQIVPGLMPTETRNVAIIRNVVSGNRRANPVDAPDELLSRVLGGLGIIVVGSDQVRVEANSVSGNRTGGIALIALPAEVAALDPRLDPNPDHATVTGNSVHGNAYDPDPVPAGLEPADVIWDGTGTGNCFDIPPGSTTFLVALPPCVPA